MNHLLNKDWEYVLHIYEEEMKGSTGWGRGEGHAKLMVLQTHCIKPSAAQPRARRGPTRAAGSSAVQLPFCRHARVCDAFKMATPPVFCFTIGDICRVWRVRSLSGLQLTSVKPSLSSRRHPQRILMNAHPSLGQEHIPVLISQCRKQ